MNGIHHLICVNLCPAQKFLLFINYYPVVKNICILTLQDVKINSDNSRNSENKSEVR